MATGLLTRHVIGGTEMINASIDSMQMPFESELRKYVKADDTNVDSLISNCKSLLDALKNLSATMASHLLDPTAYNDALTYAIMTSLEGVITANLATLGTGLPTATEDALWQRARSRAIAAGNRGAKKIYSEIAKRLPYSGMVADLLMEANEDYVSAVNQANMEIGIEQARLAYQNQRDKVREAMQTVEIKMRDYHTQRARSLQAYSTYDEHEIRNHWHYYQFLLDRALGFVNTGIEFALKAASGPDQITFENWLKMSEIMGNAQLQINSMIGELMPGGSTL